MASGDRDLDRPPRERLPSNVGEIGGLPGRIGRWRRRRDGDRVRGWTPADRVDRFVEGCDGDDIDPIDARSLRRVRDRDHEPPSRTLVLGDAHRHRENAPHGLHDAVEGELARDRPAGEGVARQAPLLGEDRDGDGQVEVGAFLGNLSGREVDRDPPVGEGKPARLERPLDSLPALADG